MGELTFHYGSLDGQSTLDGGERRFTVAERTHIERDDGSLRYSGRKRNIYPPDLCPKKI